MDNLIDTNLEELRKPIEFTVDITYINPEVIQTIYGNNDIPPNYDIEFEVEKQVRKHKKKRINKKWLKRYGTMSERRRLEGYYMIEHTDGSVEFIK